MRSVNMMARSRGAAWAVKRGGKGKRVFLLPSSPAPLWFHSVNNGHQPGLRVPCQSLSRWQSSKESDGPQHPWGIR